MSKINPMFSAIRTKDGISIKNKNQYLAYLATLPEEVLVSIKAYKRIRSNNQNRFFHGVVVPMVAEEIGEPEDDTKELLKAKFLSYTKKIKGKEEQFVRPTSSLTTSEFEELNEKIRVWASDFLKVIIPYPNEVDYER